MDWTALELNTSNGKPLYLQLCSSLTDCISEGSLQPGDKLPSERKLAELLKISRTTAVNTYKELESRGLVRSYTGRGTFVSGRPERLGAQFAWRGKVIPAVQQNLDMSIRALVTSTESKSISFGAGKPALEHFPAESYSAMVEKILSTRAADALDFIPTEGHPFLREVIAQRERVRPEEVLIVSGTQQALDLIARCLIYPQDNVVMDWPGFMGAIQTFRLAGANLNGWDILGADLDELEDIFLKRRPKLLYVNPSFQNPTGMSLSLETRQGIIDLARKYRIPIVEDEAYRGLYFSDAPAASLLELEGNGLVLHLRSFSKTLAPGLRLGYVIADEGIIDQLSMVKAQSDLFSPGLSQLVLAEMLSQGLFDSYIRVLRKKHHERALIMHKALLELFPLNTLSWTVPKGGLYIWAQLANEESRYLLQEATKQGVGFAPGDSFFPDHSAKRAFRLCYSGTAANTIQEGVKRLAKAYGTLRH